MINSIVQFVVSSIAIVVAGIFLVRFSDRIAQITKLSRLIVGSLFLAAATSLPELFVDISAVKNKMPDLAVGDLMGSSIFNLFILGIADLSHKGSTVIFSKASAHHAMAALLSMGMTALAGAAILIEHQTLLPVIGNFGLISIFIPIVYLFGLRLVYFNQRMANEVPEIKRLKIERKPLLKALSGYLLSAGAILFAAPYLSEAAGVIASQTGLGQGFIGTTLVALTTSLPELVSTIVSVRMGAYDLALGNIFGSNAFNILLLIPLDFINEGSIFSVVSLQHVFTVLATVGITSLAVMGQLYQIEKRKSFIEPDAFAVISLVVMTLIALYSFH
jgi:cation:H+ antiporter